MTSTDPTPAHAATCLWFDPEVASRAVDLYTHLVPGSRVVESLSLRNEDQPTGIVRVWTLEIAGSTVHVMGSTGGQEFTMAHSMWLVLPDQAALDRVWDGFLDAGGQELACGWLVDPFGVSWQILPAAWERLTSGDPRRAQKVAEALWQMRRIDVATLEAAAQD
ncbi:VOC family protein [Acidipropionibacterium timonense]|uniref:VOC family protein n=1 Tax=Acidipropionibacterium timonense TaxID=2161818 RepID=UPI00103029A7|nr:VOC family protein [Acidipropionibacterium timonense]